MSRTEWSNARLARLYRRYNLRYWKGKLPLFEVVAESLDKCVGLCSYRNRRITVDVEAHQSDSSIRNTLLHEMAHVAAGSKARIGHGYAFWAQIERLLRKRAPIRVGWSEMPGVKFAVGAVPARFRLCRRALRPLVGREQAEGRKILREIAQAAAKGNPMAVEEIDDEAIIADFREAAWVTDFTWKQALWSIGHEQGLIDVEGKPNSAWATKVLRRAKTVFRWNQAEKRKNEAYWGPIERAMAMDGAAGAETPLAPVVERTAGKDLSAEASGTTSGAVDTGLGEEQAHRPQPVGHASKRRKNHDRPGRG